jgi:hypothetical protein
MATARHTVGTEEAELYIYGNTTNLNYFLLVDVVPDSPETATVETTNYESYQRRAYPGDPLPAAVPTGARTYLKGLDRGRGNALPGRNFRIVALDENGSELQDREFTYVGTWKNLLSFLTDNLVVTCKVYNARGGKPVTLTVDETP